MILVHSLKISKKNNFSNSKITQNLNPFFTVLPNPILYSHLIRINIKLKHNINFNPKLKTK